MAEVPAETALRGQHLQDVVLEQPREHLRVKRAEGMKLLLPIPNAVADQRVQVGMEIEWVAVGLDGDDGPGSSGPVERLGPGIVLECLPGTTRQLSQQPPIPSEGGTQDPGNGPHQLMVIDRFQDLFAHPFHEGRHALGLAGGTEVAGLAGKGEQILFVAAATADAGKADYTLRIGTGLVELAPDQIISTTTCNGQFPGPLLRFKEGQSVTADVFDHFPRGRREAVILELGTAECATVRSR